MEGVITIFQALLGVGAVLGLVRAWMGPELIDRIVALDLVLLLLAAGLALAGAQSGSELYFAAVIVVALVAFCGTIVVARFIEWRDGS